MDNKLLIFVLILVTVVIGLGIFINKAADIVSKKIVSTTFDSKPPESYGVGKFNNKDFKDSKPRRRISIKKLGTRVGKAPSVTFFGAPGVSGGLKAQEIAKVTRMNKNTLENCLKTFQRKNRTISQSQSYKQKFRLVINSMGRIQQVKGISGNAPEYLNRCSTSRIKRWIFPRPRDQKPVVVSLPILFQN